MTIGEKSPRLPSAPGLEKSPQQSHTSRKKKRKSCRQASWPIPEKWEESKNLFYSFPLELDVYIDMRLEGRETVISMLTLFGRFIFYGTGCQLRYRKQWPHAKREPEASDEVALVVVQGVVH